MKKVSYHGVYKSQNNPSTIFAHTTKNQYGPRISCDGTQDPTYCLTTTVYHSFIHHSYWKATHLYHIISYHTNAKQTPSLRQQGEGWRWLTRAHTTCDTKTVSDSCHYSCSVTFLNSSRAMHGNGMIDKDNM
jgi:hypothetical protein